VVWLEWRALGSGLTGTSSLLGFAAAVVFGFLEAFDWSSTSPSAASWAHLPLGWLSSLLSELATDSAMTGSMSMSMVFVPCRGFLQVVFCLGGMMEQSVK